MIEFFQAIGNFIQFLAEQLTNLFLFVPYAINAIGASLATVAQLFGHLPLFLGGVGMVTVVVGIVFLILRVLHG